MLTTKKSRLAAVAATATMLVAGGGTIALASAPANSPAGGTIHIFLNVDVKSQITEPILFTGAIGDYGTATSTTQAGKPDPNGNYAQVHLKKGTFEINATALNAKVNQAPGVFDQATCSNSLSVTGTVTISNGTGLYKGISGSPTITEGIGFLAPRTASGACNENAAPLSFGGYLTGSGKVTF